MRRVLAAFFQIVHSLLEEVLDPRPAILDQKNQDRQRDGPDDQDRLETDCPALVAVNPLQQRAKRSASHDKYFLLPRACKRP